MSILRVFHFLKQNSPDPNNLRLFAGGAVDIPKAVFYIFDLNILIFIINFSVLHSANY